MPLYMLLHILFQNLENSMKKLEQEGEANRIQKDELNKVRNLIVEFIVLIFSCLERSSGRAIALS